jgi:hypothetical protein
MCGATPERCFNSFRSSSVSRLSSYRVQLHGALPLFRCAATPHRFIYEVLYRGFLGSAYGANYAPAYALSFFPDYSRILSAFC